jgi:hypothetical protein
MPLKAYVKNHDSPEVICKKPWPHLKSYTKNHDHPVNPRPPADKKMIGPLGDLESQRMGWYVLWKGDIRSLWDVEGIKHKTR